jgi:hypothetical protein
MKWLEICGYTTDADGCVLFAYSSRAWIRSALRKPRARNGVYKLRAVYWDLADYDKVVCGLTCVKATLRTVPASHPVVAGSGEHCAPAGKPILGVWFRSRWSSPKWTTGLGDTKAYYKRSKRQRLYVLPCWLTDPAPEGRVRSSSTPASPLERASTIPRGCASSYWSRWSNPATR